MNIWLQTHGNGYYLIPEGTELPPGELEIQSLSGEQRRTNREALKPYAVSREQAGEVLKTIVGPAFESLLELVTAPGGIAETIQPLVRAISARLPSEAQQAFSQAVPSHEDLAGLGELLPHLPNDSRFQDVRGLAASMRDLAQLLDPPSGEPDLAAIEGFIENRFGELLGLEESRRQDEQETEDRIRQDASNAIAAAMRRHNLGQ